MTLTVASWNINSVRLRFPIIEKFCAENHPDILCLQETKCRDSEFPSSDFRRIGYEHLAINGQKGYHGVCIVSRLPFVDSVSKEFCGKGDSRHIAATFRGEGIPNNQITIHNFYVPAGGDEPDPDVNEKFAHKLSFLNEMTEWMSNEGIGRERAVILGDFNIAPLETDVWNHKALLKIVSHTPIEVELLDQVMKAGPWSDAVRSQIGPAQRLYSWWSYRSPDWSTADKGRRLDHIWTSHDLAAQVSGASVLREARGWDKPSDHVPVLVKFKTQTL